MKTEFSQLGNHIRIVGGGTPSRDNEAYWNGDIPWATVKDLNDNKYLNSAQETITQEGIKSSASNIIKAGTVITATRIGLGKVAIATAPIAINQDLKGLYCKPELDSNYLYYFLEHNAPVIKAMGKGATVKGITLDDLKSLPLYLPPLSEQIHIAHVLDQADRLRQQDRQLLVHYDQLVQAVFMDMFGSANPEAQTWAEVRIADLANPTKNNMRTGPFGSDLLHSEFVDEGIFVLGIDNVVNNSFEWAKPRFITAEKYEKLKRYTVFPGDVLISIMATIGRTAVVPDDVPAAINSKHLAAITLNQKLAVPSFISYSLYADPKILQQLASRSKGAIMDGLNLGIIKDTKLNLPPLALQQRFAEILNQIEAQKAATQQLQAQSEALFNSLLQQAFRGELKQPQQEGGPTKGQLAFAL